MLVDGGDHQTVKGDLSTFSAHLTNLDGILRTAVEHAVVLAALVIPLQLTVTSLQMTRAMRRPLSPQPVPPTTQTNNRRRSGVVRRIDGGHQP